MALKYSKLFQPFNIGKLRIKNRVVMSPMHLGNPPMIFTDKAAYAEKMKSLFKVFDSWEIEFVKAEYNVLYYNVKLNGGHLPCVGVARYNKEGKITEYRVFVREEREF